MRGPRNLGGAMYSDGLASCQWTRNLSPAHEVEPLQQLGVADAVRLTTPEYDARAFEGAGIRHRGLLLERCTAPPRPLVAAFLGIVGARVGGGALQGGAGPHGRADRGARHAVARLHGAGRHGLAAGDAAGVRHRGAAGLPVHRAAQP